MTAKILEFKLPEKQPWFHPERLKEVHDDPYATCRYLWWTATQLRNCLTDIRYADRIIKTQDKIIASQLEQIDALKEQVELLEQIKGFEK